MMTSAFSKPELIPAAPVWIVRNALRDDATEIVFVGHANRAELDSQVERLARWPWPIDDKAPGHGVTVLGDASAHPIGIRVVGLMGGAEHARELLVSLFSEELVAQAFNVRFARHATK